MHFVLFNAILPLKRKRKRLCMPILYIELVRVTYTKFLDTSLVGVDDIIKLLDCQYFHEN